MTVRHWLAPWLFAAWVALESTPGHAQTEEATAALAGSVHGLAGTGLTLETHTGDSVNDRVEIPSDARAYTFPKRIPLGSEYHVRITTQPTNPSQTCTLRNGQGTARADVVNLSVVCFSRIPHIRK
jgi:hypothetical protein